VINLLCSHCLSVGQRVAVSNHLPTGERIHTMHVVITYTMQS